MQTHGKKSSTPAPKSGGFFQRWAGWLGTRHDRLIVSRLQRRLKAGVVVDPETGCHIWTRPTTDDGYGVIEISAREARALANRPGAAKTPDQRPRAATRRRKDLH